MAKKDLRSFLKQYIMFIIVMSVIVLLLMMVQVYFIINWKNFVNSDCIIIIFAMIILAIIGLTIYLLIKEYKTSEKIERDCYFSKKDIERCMRESQKCDEARAERAGKRFLP